MQPIKLVALDLDGTLAIENHQVLPATKAALHGLMDDGVEVVIATGRRYRSARYVIDNLGLDAYCVCNGGALVKDHSQQTLNSTPFAANEYQQIVEYARQCGIALSAQRDAHHLGGADFVMDDAVTWNPVNERYFSDNAKFSQKSDLLSQPDQYLVFGAYDSEEKLKHFAALLKDNCDHVNIVLVALTDIDYFYCEVALAAVDKWHGLSTLMTHFSLNDQNICAVGDEMNDLAMIQMAAHGIAMANGHPELQAVANYVCGHNSTDGLLDAVRYIREHNEQYGT
jgi:Cof subfamily protein (haloacid dehalogenase superfamily)